MKRRPLLRRAFAASVVAAAVLACYGPTEVVLELRTDLHARNPRTLIRVGGTTATKDGAAGDGRIGELVLVPSGARDAPVELSVVTSVDGRSPDECETSADKTGCVFARRRFKFAPHESRSFVVFMSSVCLGKDCGAQTCEDGVCVAPSENKSDTNQGGDPPPPGPPLDGAVPDGIVPDVTVDGPIDLLCPPTQRLVTTPANMAQHSLAVNASRVHWLEATKTPTVAWIANTPGAAKVENVSGDTFAIDKNTIVSTMAGSGELTRTLFGPGGGIVTSVTCPTSPISGVAILSANIASTYITQNGTIHRVNTFDPNGCGLTPIALPKGTFTTIWGTKDQIYGTSDEKTLSRVIPSVPPMMAEVFADGVPSAFATDGTAVAFARPDGMTIFAFDPSTTQKEPSPFAQLAEPLLGLAMDARHVYWLEPQPGTLSGGVVALFRKERKDGSTPELIGRYAEAHSLAADDRCLYLHGREVVRGINARTGIFARPKTWIPTINQ